jgi:streptogramin lyase
MTDMSSRKPYLPTLIGEVTAVMRKPGVSFVQFPVHVLLLIFSSSAFPATLTGTVTDTAGKPLPVAMVSLFRDDGLYLETVYAGREGRYDLVTGLGGRLRLRVRSPGHADETTTVDLRGEMNVRQDAKLRPLTVDQGISDSLTASSQFARLRLKDEVAQKYLYGDCLGCHQLGNAFTRWPRSREAWTAVVERMLVFSGLKPADHPEMVNTYVELLLSSFDGTALVREERHSYDPLYEQVMVKEWKYPEGQVAHDAVAHSRDGLFYTVDQGVDNIYITDPVANETEIFKLPALDASTLSGDPSRGRGRTNHGIHSLQEDAEGRFYLTSSYTNQIALFDPRTRGLEFYDVAQGARSPHTLRIDKKGRVWYTNIAANHVGRFDPSTKEMLAIELPATTNRDGYPRSHPYGIDVHPRDGSIWYTRLGAHRVGRIDPETLAIREFDLPIYGPRRLRFGADGTLWIPAFADGAIVRVNTQTLEHRSYRIPTLTPDGIEAPYALAVHPDTGDVWVTANMSDRMFQFIPSEERFIAYPLPTRGHYTRDIFFTKEGWVCSPSSPLPPAAVEGGMQALICIIKS